MNKESMPKLDRFDRLLLVWLILFAFTSWVMEMYIVFRVDLEACTDPLGRLFYVYAQRWDPVFLDPPVFLWLMCCADAFIFGSCYVALIWGFLRRREYIRTLGITYAAAILYSTMIYFGYEFLTQKNEANLVMVTVVNLPYVLIPIWLWWRVLRVPLFPKTMVKREKRDRSPTMPEIDF